MNMITFRPGLIVDEATLAAPPMQLPAKDDWPVPDCVDFRSYVLPPSDQGDKPACTLFATLAYIEVMNWRKHDKYEQLPALEAYDEAKRIDGLAGPGTTILAAVQAAKNLKLLSSAYKVRLLRDIKSVEYAMHRYGMCIAGLNITEAWFHACTKTGRIPALPSQRVGPHAILLNYMHRQEPFNRVWGLENSWIPWGKNSYGELLEEQLNEQFLIGAVLERDEE